MTELCTILSKECHCSASTHRCVAWLWVTSVSTSLRGHIHFMDVYVLCQQSFKLTLEGMQRPSERKRETHWHVCVYMHSLYIECSRGNWLCWLLVAKRVRTLCKCAPSDNNRHHHQFCRLQGSGKRNTWYVRHQQDCDQPSSVWSTCFTCLSFVRFVRSFVRWLGRRCHTLAIPTTH